MARNTIAPPSATLKTHRRAKTGPRGRAAGEPIGRSRLVATLGVLGLAVIVMVVLWFSLSDRGFSAVGDAADGARIVVRGVEESLDADLVSRSDVPWAADEVAHLVGWGTVMMFVGLLFRSRRGLGDLAVGVFGASIVVELLQKFVTTSRELEAEDISANSLGVMLCLILLVALDRLWPPRPIFDE